MAKVRSKLETPTARLRLAVRKKPYVAAKLARGIFLEYRRNRSVGTWICKAYGHGRYWTRVLAGAVANDHERANGSTILNYWQASERALKLVRGDGDKSAGAAPRAPELLRTCCSCAPLDAVLIGTVMAPSHAQPR